MEIKEHFEHCDHFEHLLFEYLCITGLLCLLVPDSFWIFVEFNLKDVRNSKLIELEERREPNIVKKGNFKGFEIHRIRFAYTGLWKRVYPEYEENYIHQWWFKKEFNKVLFLFCLAECRRHSNKTLTSCCFHILIPLFSCIRLMSREHKEEADSTKFSFC